MPEQPNIGGFLTNNASTDLVALTVKPFQPDIEGDLVRDFFVFFARFEYALKREGMLKGNDKRAEADWDCYAKRVRHLFETSTSALMKASVDYLLASPPQKQVVLSGELRFAAVTQDVSESSASYILRLVRTVRNNLFHGGKFPDPCGPIAETSRDRSLIRHALTILEECAKEDAGLKQRLQLDV
jgi:hypothetical protein